MSIELEETRTFLKAVQEEMLLRFQNEDFKPQLQLLPLHRNGNNDLELDYNHEVFMWARRDRLRLVVNVGIAYDTGDGKLKGIEFAAAVQDWNAVQFHNNAVKMAAQEFFFVLAERSHHFKEHYLSLILSPAHLFRGMARPETKTIKTGY